MACLNLRHEAGGVTAAAMNGSSKRSGRRFVPGRLGGRVERLVLEEDFMPASRVTGQVKLRDFWIAISAFALRGSIWPI
jgi:hypothetical protein